MDSYFEDVFEEVHMSLTSRTLTFLKKVAGSYITIDLLFILTISFIPFWRMGLSGIWEIHDQGFPLNFMEQLSNTFYSWNRYITGFGEVASIKGLPFYGLYTLIWSIGIPAEIIQRIFLLFYTTLAGWGMYYFMNTTFTYNNPLDKRLASLIASIIYMLNPFVMYWMFLGAYSIPALSFLPFVLVVLFKGLNECGKKGVCLKYVVITALLLTLLIVNAHPEVLLILTTFLSLFIIFVLTEGYDSGRLSVLINRIKFLAFVVVVSFALNLYWILSILYMEVKGSAISAMVALAPLWKIESFSEKPLLMVQLLRLQVFPYSKDEPFVFVVLGLIIFSGAILSVLLRRNSHVVFFALITVLYIGFAYGFNPPFGFIYHWLVEHTLVGKILSDPYKFLYVALFSLSVLLGIFASEVFSRLRRRRFKLFPQMLIVAMLAVILLNSYPLLSGNYNGIFEPVRFPKEYMEIKGWLNRQEGDFRILILPPMPPGYSPLYTWAPPPAFYGKQPYYMAPATVPYIFFPKPTIVLIQGNLEAYWTAYKIYYALLANETTQVGKMLNILNVKYIVVEDDLIDPRTGDKIPVDPVVSALQQQRDIQLVEEFGFLYIYENEAYRPMQIYGTINLFSFPKETWFPFYQHMIDYESFQPSEVAMLYSEANGIFSSAFDLEKNVSWTMLIRCDDVERWGKDPAYTLSLLEDTSDFVEGNGSLKVVSNGLGWSRIGYSPSEPLNFSDADFIRFWFKSDFEKVIPQLLIWDINGIPYYLEFSVSEVNVWQEVTLPLTFLDAFLNSSRINGIWLQVSEPTPPVKVTYWIDAIEVGTIKPFTFSSFSRSNVSVTYDSVNPTKYIVHVDADSPFMLVFSESYDPLWKAEIVGEKHPILEHFIVNSYANGWYINKTGRYDVILQYEPQTYLEWGIWASVTSSILLVAMPILIRKRPRIKLLLHCKKATN